MIFSYWSGQTSKNADAVRHTTGAWAAHVAGFRMFDDDDLLPILSGYGYGIANLFRRIRIPACRSDLARLVLIHEYGGLYVDAHVGPGDGFALAGRLDLLSAHELVLFCRDHCDPATDLKLMNTVIAGRRHADAVGDLIDSAVANLREHERREAATADYVPYNIFVLTGAWDISVRIFDRSRPGNPMHEKYRGRVCLDMPAEGQAVHPFRPYALYGYREPGLHWSDRQTHERLFDPA